MNSCIPETENYKLYKLQSFLNILIDNVKIYIYTFPNFQTFIDQLINKCIHLCIIDKIMQQWLNLYIYW